MILTMSSLTERAIERTGLELTPSETHNIKVMLRILGDKGTADFIYKQMWPEHFKGGQRDGLDQSEQGTLNV